MGYIFNSYVCVFQRLKLCVYTSFIAFPIHFVSCPFLQTNLRFWAKPMYAFFFLSFYKKRHSNTEEEKTQENHFWVFRTKIFFALMQFIFCSFFHVLISTTRYGLLHGPTSSSSNTFNFFFNYLKIPQKIHSKNKQKSEKFKKNISKIFFFYAILLVMLSKEVSHQPELFNPHHFRIY